MNQTDIKIIKPENIIDGDANGGRADFATEVISGIKFNLLPRVTSSERDSGVTRYRKAFIANANQLGETAYGASVGISSPGNGEDRFYIKAGTDSDTQAEQISSGWTGCGTLAVNATAGETSIQVVFKSNDFEINEDVLLIIKDNLGNSCNVRTSSTAPCASWTGNIAAVELAAQLPDNFTAFNTNVGIMLEAGDLKPSLTGMAVSSVEGGFDETAMALYNRGTEADTFSLTFESSFSYLASGIEAGTLSSGTTGSAFEPINPKTNVPYFSIPAACWSGIFEAGNTVTFSTNPACKAFWIKEVVPAGCAHEPNNSFDLDWMID